MQTSLLSLTVNLKTLANGFFTMEAKQIQQNCKHAMNCLHIVFVIAFPQILHNYAVSEF